MNTPQHVTFNANFYPIAAPRYQKGENQRRLIPQIHAASMANLNNNNNRNESVGKNENSAADRNADFDMQRWFSTILGGSTQKTLKLTSGGADQLAEACSELRRVGSSLVMAKSLGNSCLSGSLPAPSSSYFAQNGKNTWPLEPSILSDDRVSFVLKYVLINACGI